MKLSEEMYNINADISLHFIALKQQVSQQYMINLNITIGNWIKEVRKLEKFKEGK